MILILKDYYEDNNDDNDDNDINEDNDDNDDNDTDNDDNDDADTNLLLRQDLIMAAAAAPLHPPERRPPWIWNVEIGWFRRSEFKIIYSDALKIEFAC